MNSDGTPMCLWDDVDQRCYIWSQIEHIHDDIIIDESSCADNTEINLVEDNFHVFISIVFCFVFVISYCILVSFLNKMKMTSSHNEAQLAAEITSGDLESVPEGNQDQREQPKREEKKQSDDVSEHSEGKTTGTVPESV